jgi:SnoaL-like domain
MPTARASLNLEKNERSAENVNWRSIEMHKIFVVAMAASLGFSAASAEVKDSAPDTSLRPVPGWLTQAGIIAASPARKPLNKAQLADREAIRETLTLYTLALDDGNSDLLRSVLTEDATSTIYVGSATPRLKSVGRDKIVSGFAQLFVLQKDQRRHAASNMLVQNLRGNTADLTAHAIVTRTRRGETLLAGVVVYSGKMVRGKDGVWRFAALTIAIDAGEAVVAD